MTAQQLITRNLEVAKTEDRKVKLYSMVFHPNGDITHGGVTVTQEWAQQILEDDRNRTTVQEAIAAIPSPIKGVNTATKLYLKALATQAQEMDKKTLLLGADVIVRPQDQPRLSNLKKMGWVITHKAGKIRTLEITDAGWAALQGVS